MKITDAHITELYRFTREHFVEHYDVQTELVDHLANDIEQIWIEQPTLTFREAKTISFKKFGVFGFMDVVGSRQKALEKRYWKTILRFVKDWFKLPKIILTLIIYSSLFLLFTSSVSEFVFVGIISCYFFFGIGKIIQLKSIFNKRKKSLGKTWMLEDLIFKQGVGNAALLPLYTFQTFLHIGDLTSMSVTWALIASVFYTSIFIIGYISLMIIPSKAEELLLETYPEYKLV
jgi:hypothetical protein